MYMQIESVSTSTVEYLPLKIWQSMSVLINLYLIFRIRMVYIPHIGYLFYIFIFVYDAGTLVCTFAVPLSLRTMNLSPWRSYTDLLSS